MSKIKKKVKRGGFRGKIIQATSGGIQFGRIRGEVYIIVKRPISKEMVRTGHSNARGCGRRTEKGKGTGCFAASCASKKGEVEPLVGSVRSRGLKLGKNK